MPRSPRTGANDTFITPAWSVKDGRLDARFSRAAAWQLLQRVEVQPGGGPPTLAVGGRGYALGA